jgi:NAD(P)-dependent dehydrogenase (short-subunit alcohol dehydrogenase family)
MTAVVLVTGGASGIGAAVARRFARTGASVVIADINDSDGPAIAAEINGLFVPTDVTTQQDNQAAVDAFGGLDPRTHAIHRDRTRDCSSAFFVKQPCQTWTAPSLTAAT